MVSSDLYGLILAAAMVLAVVIFILALERYKLKAGSLKRKTMTSLPSEAGAIKPAAITKRRATGDMARPL
ncbi:MAG: hypothetical protein WAK95_15125 [Desulfobacterales bacterium]